MKTDSSLNTITIGDTTVYLTVKEFDIFMLLHNNKGKVFSRNKILNSVWPHQRYVLERTVDVNITRLRKKMGIMGSCIATRSGYGYYFDKNKIAELC